MLYVYFWVTSVTILVLFSFFFSLGLFFYFLFFSFCDGNDALDAYVFRLFIYLYLSVVLDRDKKKQVLF